MNNPGEDLRVLSAVLQDIMPTLARIQTRAPHGAPGAQSHMTPEAAAAIAMVSDLGADSLRRLTSFLDAFAGKHDGLENCIPLVAAAAHALAARDYEQSFTMIFESYRVIAQLRAQDPSLPMPGAVKSTSIEGTQADEQRAGGDKPEAAQGAPH
jgi:hypothetical protein